MDDGLGAIPSLSLSLSLVEFPAVDGGVGGGGPGGGRIRMDCVITLLTALIALMLTSPLKGLIPPERNAAFCRKGGLEVRFGRPVPGRQVNRPADRRLVAHLQHDGKRLTNP